MAVIRTIDQKVSGNGTRPSDQQRVLQLTWSSVGLSQVFSWSMTDTQLSFLIENPEDLKKKNTFMELSNVLESNKFFVGLARFSSSLARSAGLWTSVLSGCTEIFGKDTSDVDSLEDPNVVQLPVVRQKLARSTSSSDDEFSQFLFSAMRALSLDSLLLDSSRFLI
ncbi:hypothetical protein L1987_48867 [Smallanthus sonchifolius]|uniref:Uncharacterized protein n=1 Tax=Smallanthus sonchifolius TaxID=185202 RepID=A0ACB9FU19_9ASTR|nr:hypothetical protein L1987_48867 [Smallanthus sonchifolius]